MVTFIEGDIPIFEVLIRIAERRVENKDESEKSTQLWETENRIRNLENANMEEDTALARIDEVLDNGLTRADVEDLVERITVDKDRNLVFKLRVRLQA